MKKVLAIVMAAVMVLSLAACGGSAATADTSADTAVTSETKAEAKEEAAEAAPAGEKTKLTVWMAPRGDGREDDATFWKEQFAPFEEENNCEIDLSVIPWESYEEKALAGFSSGEGPDVCYMFNEILYDYIDLEQLEPLDNYLTDEDKENYLHLESGVYNGKQYTMPTFIGEPRVLYYNNDLLTEMGLTVPETWDEFVEVCLAIKEKRPDLYPYMQGWNVNSYSTLLGYYFPWFWSAGGNLMDFDGTVKLLDGEEGLEATQFVSDLRFKYDIIPEECAGLTEDDVWSLFTAGQLVFCIGNVQALQDFRDSSGYDVQFSHVPGYGTADNWQTYDGADCLVMNAASTKKDLSWSLIKYITSPSVMEAVHQRLAIGVPLTKDETSFVSDEFNALYEGSHMQFIPVAKNGNAVLTNLLSNLQLMMLGEQTAEEALQKTVDYSKTLN